jgi:uncharacterized protein with FMN-binding domain
LTLGGTAAGIAALVAVKFQPAASTASAAGPQSLAAPAATAPAAAPSGTAHSAGPPGGGKPSASPTRGSGSSGGSSAGGAGGTGAAGGAQSITARTFTGSADNTQEGPMQVAITVSGKTITKITVVQQTDNGSESNAIDATALPKLTSEALAAQSAKIDTVSGASYTSAGYIQSLQSAIDQAGL